MKSPDTGVSPPDAVTALPLSILSPNVSSLERSGYEEKPPRPDPSHDPKSAPLEKAKTARRSVSWTSAPMLASAKAIATPKKRIKLWKLRRRLIYNMALIFVFVLLDVQDLLYKILWVGPNESFMFRTEVMGVLRDSILIPSDPSFNVPESINVDRQASSWPHFLSSCANLTAFDAGGGFFAIALGTNCTIGQGSARRSVEHMIMSSSVRLDSIVWTACKLLYQWQQPFICRSPIVTKYLDRYVLPDTSVNISSLAEPGSDAEKEVFAFLDMVSKSYPLHKMVCVEAFEWTNQSLGIFRTSLYGCASPNLMRSEFLGVSNPVVRELLAERVWLTADVFQWFSLRFGIRQNARNKYFVEKTSDDKFQAAAHTSPNFTCFGPLYSIMLALDILLLIVNVSSYWEFTERVLIPRSNELVRRHRRQLRETLKIKPRTTRRRFAQPDLIHNMSAAEKEKSVFRPSVKLSPRSKLTITLVQPSWIPVEHMDLEELKCILPCSLQRSWPGIFAVMVSQMLSWMLIMPNSVVWVWGLSTITKIQAFFTSLRVWMLLVVTCNLLWDCVVKLNEEWAFAVTSRTFIAPFEIVVVGAAMAAWKILDIFLMCERKWAIESQRVNDASAFAGGYIAHGNTYQPSVEVLFSTPTEILAIVYSPLLQILGASILCLSVYLGLKAVVLKRLSQRVSARLLVPNIQQLTRSPDEKYARMPMEEESNCPIRAKSLVRLHQEMEHTFQGQQYIRPFCYLENGILPRQTRFTTRTGFTNFLPLKYEKRTRILQAKQWKFE
ncbi:hypothetical protein Gpo141_00007331 [Globisporangium polare]